MKNKGRKKRLNLLVIVLAVIILAAVVLVGVKLGEEKEITGEVVSEKRVVDYSSYKENSLSNESRPKFYGYIIKFKDKSVIEKKAEIEKLKIKGKLTNELKKYKDTLKNNHKTINNKILQKLGKKDLKILNEYYNVFNGIALNITTEEAEKLKQLPEIEEVYPNYEVNITLMDSVPLINADDVWQLDKDGNNCSISGKECLTGKNITIAILDTGIDYTHEDLGGCFGQGCKVIRGYDFYNNDADPMDDHGHGTHVAGIAAGNGVLKGVAPDAKLYAYKVLNYLGGGSGSQVIAGIERAADPNLDGDFSDHVDVISMSLGANCRGYYNKDCGPDDPVSQAVDNAVDAGVVVVVAAGNSGPGEKTIESPGTARKVITVGASNKLDSIASFSSRGPVIGENFGLLKPDIIAPGVNICSAQWNNAWNSYKCFDNKHIAISGTSMSTPHVAGAVALLKQAHPDWTSQEIKLALRNTAVNIGEPIFTQGYGRIDVEKAAKSTKTPIAEIKTSGEVKENINILGTASGEEFRNYTLYYGESLNPQNWNLLYSSSTEVNDEILYFNFDTSKLKDGYYILRLLVSSTESSIEDMSVIEINNIELISPTNNNILRAGEIIEIKGTVTSEFQNYKIEYSTMTNLSTWYSEGITLTSGGSQKIINSTLAIWNTTLITKSDNYIIRLTVNYKDNSLSEQYIENIYLDPTFKEGWPQKVNKIYSPFFRWERGQPAIGDIDNDGEKDIVLSGSDEVFDKVFAFHSNGSLIKNFPIRLNDKVNYHSGAAIGDINNDGYEEIVFPTGYSILIIENGGRNIRKIPLWRPGYDPALNMITLSDINNDGYLDVLTGDHLNTLHVINASSNNTLGSPPIYLDGWLGGKILDSPEGGGSKIIPVISSGDLNKDGYDEVITFIQNENSAKLYAFNYKGIILPGYPKDFKNDQITSNIFLIDLNNDTFLDIFFSTSNGLLYAFNKNGENIRGWPINLSDKYLYDHTFSYHITTIFSSTIGDLDNDNDIDIALSVNTNWGKCIFILNSSNIEDVSRKIKQPQCSKESRAYDGGLFVFPNSMLLFANIDEDIHNEIIYTSSLVFSTYYKVYWLSAFNHDGTFVEGFPKRLPYPQGDTSPVVDIDNDGYNELIVFDRAANFNSDRMGNLLVWETNGIANNEWPMFQHDPQHTGRYTKICEDSDFGKNYTRKGKVELRTGEIYEDECPGTAIVVEKYCENGKIKTESFSCSNLDTVSNKYRCENGACQKFCEVGWKCKDSNTRAYQNSDCSWANLQMCFKLGTGYKCIDGACIKPAAQPTPPPEAEV